MLSDALVWALEFEEIGGVKLYCEKEISPNVKDTFTTTFETEWNLAVEKVGQEYGHFDCARKTIPAHGFITDYGVFVRVGALDIVHGNGDFCDLEYGRLALENTLKALKAQFPSIEYEGLVAFPWSTSRSGEVTQYIVSSAPNHDDSMVFDFIGTILDSCLNCDSHLWARQEDADLDEKIFVITGKLQYFENRDEISEYIEDLGATVTGSVSRRTSYLINNDRKSASSKNAKAKELGIPIISEEEFICRFGDPDDYDDIFPDDDEFWNKLSMQVCDGDEDTYRDVVESIYDYRQWIDHDTMEHAFQSIIDMMCEVDPDIRETLVDIAKEVLSRES